MMFSKVIHIALPGAYTVALPVPEDVTGKQRSHLESVAEVHAMY